MRSTILTVTGRYFDLLNPEASEYGIVDIAHALSNQGRFTGHTRSFYSVAQHSVLVSFLVPPELAFAGLMHDAAEAFVGDVATPLKELLPEYKAIERRIEADIFRRFDLPPELPPEVKIADLVALATEKRDLMMGASDEWWVLQGVRPSRMRIWAKQPNDAKMMFLHRLRQLRPDLMMEGLLSESSAGMEQVRLLPSDAVSKLLMEQAILIGELSKSLLPDDPLWEGIKDAGARLDELEAF